MSKENSIKVNGKDGLVAFFDKPDEKGSLKLNGFIKYDSDSVIESEIFFSTDWGYGKDRDGIAEVENKVVNADGSVSIVVSKVIYIPNFLERMIENRGQSQLITWLESHKDDTSFYTKVDENGFKNWYKNIYDYTTDYKANDVNIKCDYRNLLSNGTINVTVNSSYYLVYDVNENDFITINRLNNMRSRYSDNNVATLLEICYGHEFDLQKLLAIYQYNIGNGHDAFRELVLLQNYLTDKKSLKIVLKGGSVHTLKPDSDLRVNHLFIFSDGKFELSGRYDITPSFNKQSNIVSVNEIEYLQYGKNKYYVNVDKLAV